MCRWISDCQFATVLRDWFVRRNRVASPGVGYGNESVQTTASWYYCGVLSDSVPARLGKGQGAKEIGHSLARERPKFGHNLVRERHIIGHSLEREWPKFGRNPAHERNEVWAQFCGRSMKTWAQICKHFTSIFKPLSENTKTAVTFCK